MTYFQKLFNLTKNPVARSVGIYTFTNFFAKAVSFILLFVFTNPKYITASENGLLSLYSNGVIFLVPFVTLGIIHATSTDFFKMDKNAFSSYFSSGFVMPIIITILSIIVLYFFKERLERQYGFPPLFVWLIPVVTFLTFCNEQLLSVIRNNNEPGTYLKANVSKTILELGLSFILVVFFAWRWEGRLAGILVAYLVLGLYAFYYFYKKGYLFGNISKAHIKHDLIYAIPILALQGSIFAMSSSDKFYLSAFTNDKNETVGIYSIACVFGSVIIVMCTALLQYVFPKIYTLLSEQTINYSSIRKHFYLYAGGTALSTVLMIIITPFLYHYFINEKYHEALQYVYILCIGYFFWCISYFFYSFLLFNKQKRKILFLSIVSIVISIGCNYFFISRWQDVGAAWAVFTCYLLVLVVTLLVTRNYWKEFLFLESGNPKEIKPNQS